MWSESNVESKKFIRVLKPPGGGSSDIFGASDTPSRKAQVNARKANQSQLSEGFFSDSETDLAPAPTPAPVEPAQTNGASGSSSNLSSAPDTPRSKPGNDSYNRLFGPPDAPPPSTPNSNTYRSSISLSNAPLKIISSNDRIGSSSICGSTDSLATDAAVASAAAPMSLANGKLPPTNGFHHNDVIGGLSGMPRNPVTGDGVDMKPPATKRYIRRSKDGNPVTGAGYESMQHNGGGSTGSSIAGSDKSSTDSSPSIAPVPRMKNRVPPGGFSSGLW